MPDYIFAYESYRRDLDGALRQLTDEEFHTSPGGSANSVAAIIKHLSGNLASRFTDFLTSDGEKPWREREAEFHAGDQNRTELMEEFERTWGIMLDAVSKLSAADLQKTITIRGKPLLVADAVLRSVAHFASHVGQVIMIGKLLRGDDWEYLSIPPGGTDAYNEQSREHARATHEASHER